MPINLVAERIKRFLLEHFPLARGVGSDDPLLGNGIIDSLGVLEVVAFLEQEFQVTVADEELLPENFQSLATLAAFIHAKLSHAPYVP